MIKRINLSGYRLLHDVSIDLDNLNVVIGANASGKSTLLDFLQLMSHMSMFPLKQSLDWHSGISSLLNPASKSLVKAELQFIKPNNENLWSGMPLEPNRLYSYELHLGLDGYGQPEARYECLRTSEPNQGYPNPFKFLEAAGPRCMIFDASKKNLVPFDEAPKDPRVAAATGQGNAPQEPSDAAKQEISLRLTQMRFFNEYPVPSWVRSYISAFAFYPGFEVGRFSDLRNKPSEIAPRTTLEPSGANLGTVLHELLTRHSYRDWADKLRDFLRVGYPWLDDVYAETTYGSPPRVLVRVREKDVPRVMDVWELSDGMLRFLCLGAALLNPDPPSLIALDEPEIGFHPRLLPLIADMVKMASERTQVILTTHSPDLLNQFSIEQIAVMVRGDSHANWIRPGNRPALQQLLRSVTGETVGDLHRSGELEVA